MDLPDFFVGGENSIRAVTTLLEDREDFDRRKAYLIQFLEETDRLLRPDDLAGIDLLTTVLKTFKNEDILSLPALVGTCLFLLPGSDTYREQVANLKSDPKNLFYFFSVQFPKMVPIITEACFLGIEPILDLIFQTDTYPVKISYVCSDPFTSTMKAVKEMKRIGKNIAIYGLDVWGNLFYQNRGDRIVVYSLYLILSRNLLFDRKLYDPIVFFSVFTLLYQDFEGENDLFTAFFSLFDIDFSTLPPSKFENIVGKDVYTQWVREPTNKRWEEDERSMIGLDQKTYEEISVTGETSIEFSSSLNPLGNVSSSEDTGSELPEKVSKDSLKKLPSLNIDRLFPDLLQQYQDFYSKARNLTVANRLITGFIIFYKTFLNAYLKL